MSTTTSFGVKNLDATDTPTLPIKLTLEAINDIFFMNEFLLTSHVFARFSEVH